MGYVLWGLGYGLRAMFIVDGLWFVVYGLWVMIYASWVMVYVVWFIES